MPKVRKLAKYVLNLWVNISRTKTAIAKKGLCHAQARTFNPFYHSWLALNNAQIQKIEDISKTE